MDFDYYTDRGTKWLCIEGGTQRIPNMMNERLAIPVENQNLDKLVTRIAFRKAIESYPDEHNVIEVQVAGEESHRNYASVFSTVSLACLQRIDLTDLELSYGQTDALRSLQYENVTKVGVKFRFPWVRI